MKPTILIYCGEDGEAGKALAASLRDGNSHVVMCAASAFDVVQRHGDRIEFTNGVPRRLRDKISAAHGFPSQDNVYADVVKNLEPAPFINTIEQPVKRPRGRPRKIVVCD